MANEDVVRAALTKGYREIKNKLSELSAREKEIRRLKVKLEEKLFETLSEEIPSYRTPHGTVSDYQREFFKIDQLKLVHRHVAETGDYDIFGRTLNSEYIKKYMEENEGELPPGVVRNTVRCLSFTQPRKQVPER